MTFCDGSIAPRPPRGEVTIFNRSHDEDVLIARVHNLAPREIWSRRYDRISAFESGLVADGAQILKFYLHISKEEQLKRFKDRLDDHAKQWKISEADYEERTYRDAYTPAYEEALFRCSTPHAPHGSSFPLIISGSETWPWPGSSSNIWKS